MYYLSDSQVHERFSSLLCTLEGVSLTNEPDANLLAGVERATSELAKSGTAPQFAAEVRAAVNDDFWALHHGLRAMGSLCTCVALRTGRIDPLCDLLLVAASDFSGLFVSGLLELLADALGKMTAGDLAKVLLLDGLRSRGAMPGIVQIVGQAIELPGSTAADAGWLFIDGEDGPWVSFDPPTALATEMESPDPDREGDVSALDIDVSKVSIGLLPIPSGRDLRIAQYVRTLGNADRFMAAAAVMNETREHALSLFVGRWAVRAVRESNPVLLDVAMLAASLPSVPSRGPDPADYSISSVLIAASRLGLSLLELADGIRSLVDPPRYQRVQRIALQPERLLDIGGLEIRQGPDGFALLGRRY